MIPADEIMRRGIAQRTAQGLKLTLQTPYGVKTMYPKDKATLALWTKAALAKGYGVLQ